MKAITEGLPRTGVMVAVGLIVLAFPSIGFAADETQPNWLQMAIGLLGGLALFLFGMDQMTTGLKAAAGEKMKIILSRLSSNRVAGAITGALVTAVIQSSSVTTVLVVGFVTAGLMTTMQSIGIIFGANVGTTVTAQIVAFNVTEAALPMIAVGFAMGYGSKSGNGRHYGAMLMGLGLIFYGMAIMGDAMSPLRSFPPFLELMQALENPLLGILVAALFTALVQSSSATISLAVVMATQGFVTLAAGIPIVFGAKIGTCITAMLASIGKPRDAVRAAAVHVTYNVLGALLWIFFIDQLAAMSVAVSPEAPELDGTARLAEEVPRQVANAATIWALANVVIFLPFAGYFARFVEWLIPDRAETTTRIVEPKFLDPEIIAVPSIALERMRLEIGHMAEWVQRMLAEIKPAIRDDSTESIEEIIRSNDRVVILRDHILDFARRLGREELTDRESAEHDRLLRLSMDLESLAHEIKGELLPVGRRFREQGIEASETTGEMLEGAYDAVCGAVDAAVRAVVHEDESAAQDVLMHREAFWRMSESMFQRQMRLLRLDDADRLKKHRLQTDVLNKLRRLHGLAESMAATVLPDDVVAQQLEAEPA